jgi:hypothetical protein
LGDYVDRGYDSKGNVDFLLEEKKKHPEQVYLLLGNHDAFEAVSCYPRDFWEGLDKNDFRRYSDALLNLPLAVSAGPIIALHGALPDIRELKEMNEPMEKINWMQIIWGDFLERKGRDFGENYKGRPEFGEDYFNDLMKRFNKNVLIRGHQSNAPERMFDNRCLTIFTSSAYKRRRVVGIADFSKAIKTIDDLIIREI